MLLKLNETSMNTTKLSEMDQIRFQELKNLNPQMSDQAIGTRMAIQEGIAEVIDANPSITKLDQFTEELWNTLQHAILRWVSNNLPDILEAVKNAVIVVWDKITDWFANGGLTETLERFWAWLTDVILDSY